MTAVTGTVAFHLVTLAGRVAGTVRRCGYGVKVKYLCLLVAIDAARPRSSNWPARCGSRRAWSSSSPTTSSRSGDRAPARQAGPPPPVPAADPAGRRLLAACGEAARRVDEELAASLDPGQR